MTNVACAAFIVALSVACGAYHTCSSVGGCRASASVGVIATYILNSPNVRYPPVYGPGF